MKFGKSEIARQGETKPLKIGWLERHNLRKVHYDGQDYSYREFAERMILSKYASITDPELKRMTLDAMNFLEQKATAIESAPDALSSPYEPIGDYNLIAGDIKTPARVTGLSKRETFYDGVTGSQNTCGLHINIACPLENRSLRFDTLLKDIAMLSGFMPPDYEWDIFDNSNREKREYENKKRDFKVSFGKGVDPGTCLSSLHFRLHQKNMPMLLEAVRKIKLALTEPEKFLPSSEPKGLPPAQR